MLLAQLLSIFIPVKEAVHTFMLTQDELMCHMLWVHQNQQEATQFITMHVIFTNALILTFQMLH